MRFRQFRFREFPVYGSLRAFGKRLKDFSKTGFPADERFGLTGQMWRAIDSTILNLAEGSCRASDRDFAHYLNMATASLHEVVACLDVASDCGYLPGEVHGDFLAEAAGISEQLTAFRKKVLQ
jgi:four helix bundle protein